VDAGGRAGLAGGRSRLFIAPAGLWLALHAGKIEAAEYSTATGAVNRLPS
jgi:hypothetical protein